nr:MAG TPA: hypothetical protein [Caudoviricetes sp.]
MIINKYVFPVLSPLYKQVVKAGMINFNHQQNKQLVFCLHK